MIQKSCKFPVLHHGSDEYPGGAEISGKESAAAEIPDSRVGAWVLVRVDMQLLAISRQPEGVFQW